MVEAGYRGFVKIPKSGRFFCGGSIVEGFGFFSMTYFDRAFSDERMHPYLIDNPHICKTPVPDTIRVSSRVIYRQFI